jgi:hypothetical protein
VRASHTASLAVNFCIEMDRLPKLESKVGNQPRPRKSHNIQQAVLQSVLGLVRIPPALREIGEQGTDDNEPPAKQVFKSPTGSIQACF